ncbi:MAG: hypothetical protein JXR46_14840 [Calditrichaceae bacterium]|nr:hypothetical protein [Calditrichaceae bacterium]RQV93382.1 MAG: hypothetical protein EH224_12630 [Calditrichota bacterium]
MRRFINIFIIFMLTGAGLAAEADCFPPDNLIGGWKKFGNSRVFNQSDLYGHINGGAELFLEFGFEKLAVRHYKNGDNEIGVELYAMADNAAATGIYLMKCGRETPDSMLNVRHTVNKFQLILKQNRYFVLIMNYTGKNEYMPVMIQMAGYMSAQLPADEKVTEFDLLPVKGLINNSVRLMRGPYALQAVYTFGQGDILMLDGTISAVSGIYIDDNQNTYRMIIAEYPDQNAAKTAYENIKKGLDQYLEVIEWQEDGFKLKDSEGRFITGKLTDKLITIKLNLSAVSIID